MRKIPTKGKITVCGCSGFQFISIQVHVSTNKYIKYSYLWMCVVVLCVSKISLRKFFTFFRIIRLQLLYCFHCCCDTKTQIVYLHFSLMSFSTPTVFFTSSENICSFRIRSHFLRLGNFPDFRHFSMCFVMFCLSCGALTQILKCEVF